jgi:hypothetical protein
MNRDEFYATMAPSDEARLRKIFVDPLLAGRRPAPGAHRGRAAPAGPAEGEAEEGSARPGTIAGVAGGFYKPPSSCPSHAADSAYALRGAVPGGRHLLCVRVSRIPGDCPGISRLG